MVTTSYVLRIGNGNDGNYPHAVIDMGENDCPYAFMECVIPNQYTAGRRERFYAYKNVIVDGEAEYTIYATLHDDYRGYTEFGAAIMTASLEEDPENEFEYLDLYTIDEYLDRGAYIKYKQKLKK